VCPEEGGRIIYHRDADITESARAGTIDYYCWRNLDRGQETRFTCTGVRTHIATTCSVFHKLRNKSITSRLGLDAARAHGISPRVPVGRGALANHVLACAGATRLGFPPSECARDRGPSRNIPTITLPSLYL
jgi:hypothetical protein